MKIALVQKNINNPDLVGFLATAKEVGADLVCFPELAATGCVYQKRQLEPLSKLETILAPYEMDIMVGAGLPSERGLVNAYLHYCGGVQHVYYKVNLFEPFNEPDVFEAGNSPGIWETQFGRVGVSICYDIRFDNLYDQMKKAEVELTFIPAAFPRERVAIYRELLVKRAKQTESVVIGINCVGDDGRNEFGGSSSVISPEGEVLVSADETTETIIYCDL